MQEQRSKDEKKTVVTPLMNHVATPSSFPQLGEPWLDDGVSRTLDSTAFVDRRLKKPLQLEEEVVAAMV